MFFTDSKAAILDDKSAEFLEGFETEGGGYPFIQALTHPNEGIFDVVKQRPWGFFINQENAEMIEFQPDENWKPITFYTNEEDGFAQAVLEMPEDKRKYFESQGIEVTEHKGYVSTTLMFHIIWQSDNEVEHRGENGTRFVGIRWQGSEDERQRIENLLAERDADDRPTHRVSQRFLLLLIDKDGHPLAKDPVQYRAKGGAGGAFSIEVGKELSKDLLTAYAQGKGNSRLRMFDKRNHHGGDLRAFVKHAFQFDLYKPGKDSAPYLVPTARIQPVGDPKITKPSTDKRGKDGEREIQLIPSLLIHVDPKTKKVKSNLLVSQGSEMGQLIRELIDQHKEFPTPNTGDNGGTSTTGEQPYIGEGMLDMSTLDIRQDGTYVTLMTDDGAVPLLIGPEHPDALDHMSLKIQGTIPADGGPVQVTAWESVDVMGDTSEPAQQPLMPSFG